ncbi:MAG: hypothetical protein GY862_05505, partial [Gammaproteobacteria bacterium]|nr:hypothetical protein [Gammaproteobacteria bacterium]
PALTHTLDLPELNSRRLGLSYEPESEADAAALEKFRAAGATSIPLYLLRVKPMLKLDSAVLTGGSGIGMGQPQYYTLELKGPRNTYTVKGVITAGDEAVFGINGNGIVPEIIQKRLDAMDPGSAAENLHQTALNFWMEHDLFDRITAEAYGVYRQRMPSAGVFSAPLRVWHFMGVARSGNYSRRVLDVKHNVQVVRAPDEQTRFDFMNHIGIQGSYIEGSVLDQLFGRNTHPAISTARILTEANARNIPVYTVTQANVNSVLPQLSVSAEVKADIAHAVNSGKRAIVPKHDLALGNWSGTGYIIQDSATGAGAYLIEGGLNGGTWEGCEITVYPIINNPVLKVFKDIIAIERFKNTQALLTGLIKAGKALGRDTSAFEEALDVAVLVFRTTLDNAYIEPMISNEGCFVAQARKAGDEGMRYAKEVVYIPVDDNSPVNAPIKADVEFVAAGVTRCFRHHWTMRAPEQTQANSIYKTYRHSFTKTGKYFAEVSADCKGNLNTLKSTIEVNIARVEMNVFETNHRENRIAQDDPRRAGNDKTARNKLLVWHDGTGNGVEFSVEKQDENSEFWVEISGTGILPWKPVFKKLTAKSTPFSLNAVLYSYFPYEFEVKYGLDHNKSDSLDKDEIKGRYEIYGLTDMEYLNARSAMLVFLSTGLFQLADALVHRFTWGEFNNPYVTMDYSPTKIKSKSWPNSYT